MEKLISVSDLFFSIQGEGKNIGKPFIFIRFALCNLSCDWCDTKYSWHKDFLDFKTYTLSELLKNIENLSREKHCRNILFTGGEPLLHQDAIRKIMNALPTYFFEIETNGSIETELPFDQINVSFKLKNAKTRTYTLKILPFIQSNDSSKGNPDKGNPDKYAYYCKLQNSAANASDLLTVSFSDTPSSVVQRFRSNFAIFVTKSYLSGFPKYVQQNDGQSRDVQNKFFQDKNIQNRNHQIDDIRHKNFLRKNVSYKFVISHENDILEALNICEQYKIPLKNVYLMPEGIRKEAVLERGKWLKKRCRGIGVQFTPRLHILLWGNKRGV
ncbi:7-carboxy-7-deazaguanine synthase QueE [Candidatus Peregrinibacteria bacterium]|nr:7-carboxy-7-deazaguanine synthase QueE [Candidatus Peregrinibacteria bacterium]